VLAFYAVPWLHFLHYFRISTEQLFFYLQLMLDQPSAPMDHLASPSKGEFFSYSTECLRIITGQVTFETSLLDSIKAHFALTAAAQNKRKITIKFICF
jgi:hypothetical protein